MFKKILVPIDGSEPSWKTLEYARTIGEKFASNLLFCHINNDASFLSSLPIDSEIRPIQMMYRKDREQNLINAAKEKLTSYPAMIEFIMTTGHPAECILNLAEKEDCDLIVIGARGLSGIKKFLIGSVSSNVARYSRIPVLVVKEEKV